MAYQPISTVFGTASLILGTQADNVANTTDTLLTSSLLYVYDGSTWDRLRGDATDGMLVNLGANNDVTVTGSVTANAGTNLNTSALLTTADFGAVFGNSGLILTVQGDDTVNTIDSLVTSSLMYVFDGTTWDRLYGDSTDGVLVNLGANNDVVVSATNLDIRDLAFASDKVDASGSVLGAGTNNIGDVDVLTVPSDPFGANADAASATGSISAKLRFIASTGIPITGTVTVGSHAVTNAGTFAVQVDGAALTALQLLDDVVAVLGTDTYTEATSKGYIIGAVRRDADTTLVNTTNEFGPLQMDANGRLKVEVFDGGESHTVDAPVGTPVNVQIGNATLTAGVVDETGASAVDALAVGGGTPHDSVDSGNPQKIGFKAHNALPTAVANNDRANGISDLFGRQMVTHIDPAQHITKVFNATTAQTGTDVWSPTSGKRIAITSIVIGTYGTTAGRVILWFGDNADTTYTAGTDQAVLAFSTAPSATSKPGLVFTPAFPVFCTTADRELHITTDAAVSIDVVVHGYEY